MKHLKIFEEFSRHPDFAEFIEKELNWNGPSCTLLDSRKDSLHSDTEEVETYTGYAPGTWDVGYSYTCLPGSSVREELIAAIRKYDPTLKYRIARTGDTSRRAHSHDYVIILKLEKKNVLRFVEGNFLTKGTPRFENISLAILDSLEKKFPTEMSSVRLNHRGKIAAKKFNI